jgi:hypothetical protein
MVPFSLARLAQPSFRRSITTGGLASVAYLVEQALDRRAIPNDYDDLVLWGGFLARDPLRQRLIGSVVHVTLGTALAAAYEAALPLLPSWPGPLKGLLFVQAENAILYPGVPVINAVHPSVRLAEMPSLLTWRYFVVELMRHAAFGLTLGWAEDRQ